MQPEDQRRPGPDYTTICRTLVFLTRGDEVLLLKGAPHKRLWAGKYNGIGGHLEPGESPHAAALRELGEETGIASADLELRGIVHITMPEPPGIVLFVYTGTTEDVPLIASEEGVPTWVHRDDLDSLPLGRGPTGAAATDSRARPPQLRDVWRHRGRAAHRL